MAAPTLVWLRDDLRVDDNPALHAAKQLRGPVIPVYIRTEGEPWALGPAARWWLADSLESLAKGLKERSSRLILRAGEALPVLRDLLAETGAEAIYWNRRYTPHHVQVDTQVKAALSEQGLEARSFNGSMLWEPWEVTRSGRTFQTFTSYHRAALALGDLPVPEGAIGELPAPEAWPSSEALGDWSLRSHFSAYPEGFNDRWKPGENEARRRLERFLDEPARRYYAEKHRPDLHGTSRLSPSLRFGEISPRRLYHETLQQMEADETIRQGGRKFLQELHWRDFAKYLLYTHPQLAEEPLRRVFGNLPWREDDTAFEAWKNGQTGYPLVDAAMRELRVTGWMHNRMRMVTASFLTKDLLIPWQKGEAWFWECLVDGDMASNAMNWQWVTGCGVDGTGFQRIFNPVTQGHTFDPDGSYVRRWVPEVAPLAVPAIHAPWTASPMDSRLAEIVLGTTYPEPIVDHAEARKRALEAVASLS